MVHIINTIINIPIILYHVFALQSGTKKQELVKLLRIVDESVTTDEALVEEQLGEHEQLPEYPLDTEGRVQK